MLDGNMKTMKNNEQWKCSLIRIIALLELIKRNVLVYLYLYVRIPVLVGSQTRVWLTKLPGCGNSGVTGQASSEEPVKFLLSSQSGPDHN